jgi:hypothetical protein
MGFKRRMGHEEGGFGTADKSIRARSGLLYSRAAGASSEECARAEEALHALQVGGEKVRFTLSPSHSRSLAPSPKLAMPSLKPLQILISFRPNVANPPETFTNEKSLQTECHPLLDQMLPIPLPSLPRSLFPTMWERAQVCSNRLRLLQKHVCRSETSLGLHTWFQSAALFALGGRRHGVI